MRNPQPKLPPAKNPPLKRKPGRSRRNPKFSPPEQDATESAKAAPAEKRDAPDETVAEAPAKKEKAPEPERKKKKKRTVDMSSGPQVRVISVPKAPPRPAAPAPGPRPSSPSSRPGKPPRNAPAAMTPPPPSGKTEGRKRKKDRRVVEFGQADPFDKKFGRKRDDNLPESFRGKKKKGKRKGPDQSQGDAHAGTQPLKAAKRKIKVDETIRLSDMAKQMGIKAQELIRILFSLGVMATINQSLDMDTATLVAGEFGYEIESVGFGRRGIPPAQGSGHGRAA